MCKAFSCVATKKKVYWKLGLDSHNDIVELFKLKDDKIGKIVPIEITPNNQDYINPDKWTLKFDDEMPEWWKKSNESMCWSAHKEWYKQLRSKLHIKRLNNLVNPFKLPIVNKVNKYQINLLKEWDSVRDSVRDSVWDSVWASVWDSVWASVGDSVWAYIGYNFNLKRSEWQFTENIKTKGYPFMPLVKLWKQGLVPSFDGKIWRLHSGKKAKIVFEISKQDLEKQKGTKKRY